MVGGDYQLFNSHKHENNQTYRLERGKNSQQ